MKKAVISTKNAPLAIGPYEQGIRVGPVLVTSGQIPLDPESGEMVQGEIEEATERVILNLKAVLEAGGSSLERVIKTSIYLTDMGLFARVNAVYDKHFGSSKPARACVEVSSLPKGASVEIEAVALIEQTDEVTAVLVTVPNEEEGEKIARGLVKGKLAACVQMVPGLRSIYLWEGTLCDEREMLLIIKTRRDMFDKVCGWVEENHSYDTPQVVALPVIDGSGNYLDWVRENCAGL